MQYSRISAWIGATIISMVSAAAVAGNGHDERQPQVDVSTFASGLNNPRGLKFGPDGDLYVAEAGLGVSRRGYPLMC